MALFSRVITYTNGSVLTGPQLNAEFDNIIDKMTGAYIEDYSSDAAEMGAATDPYPAGTVSLATTLQGELTNMRYALAEQGQVDKWYKDKYKVRTVDNTDSPVTVSIDDWMILCDDSSGAVTLNLPAQASLPSGTSKSFVFVCLNGTNNVTVDGNASETIGGVTTIELTVPHQTVHLFCEDGGSDWRVLGGGWLSSSTRIAGTGSSVGLYVQPTDDNATGLLSLAGSATATTGSSALINFQNYLDADGSSTLGRISLIRAADGDSELRFQTGNAGSLDAYWAIDEDGHLYPDTADSSNIGSEAIDVDFIYFNNWAATDAVYWTLEADGDIVPQGTYNLGASGGELDQIWADSVRTAGTLKFISGASIWTVEPDGDLIPTGTYDIGASGKELSTVWLDTITSAGDIKITSGATTWTWETDGDLIPTGTYDLGASGSELDQIWADSFRSAGTLKFYSGANYWTLGTTGNLVPNTDDTHILGSDALEIAGIYTGNVSSSGTIALTSGVTVWTMQTDGDLVPTGAYDLGASGSELGDIWAASIGSAGAFVLASGAATWTLDTSGNWAFPGGSTNLTLETAATNTVSSLNLIHDTSGSMADGFGVGLYLLHSESGSSNNAGRLYTERVNASDADAMMTLSIFSGSEQKMLRLFPGTTGNRYVGPGTDDDVDCGNSSYRWDDVYATNATIQTSDVTMKSDVTPIELGLDFLNKVNPIEFRWKDKSRKHFGFSAQQIEQVIDAEGISSQDFAPLIKSEVEGDTRYGLRSNELMPIMWKAVQELTTKIKYLEEKAYA